MEDWNSVSSLSYCVAYVTKLSVDPLFFLWLRFVDPEIFKISQFLGSCNILSPENV